MMIQKFKFFEGIIEDTYIVDVQPGIRTLRATWQRQDIEELNAYHAIDAEAELTRILSEQWAEEIDREVMRTMLDTVNTENETDMEVLRGMDVLNDNNELETTRIISEITRLINGGQRA